MKRAVLRREKMVIPTYGVGKEEKLPMFFEKRVYQGSSGRVYPNPVTEKIFDEREDREYDAIILENEYIYVVVLPELGGRIYTAYDKSNGYDFVYHNHVIKPALVGLLGPWISGGIEFNWPQHHRPSTFRRINCRTFEHGDGSVSVCVGEVENMFGLEQTARIRVYPGRAYIEISVQIFNRSEQEQTFLWWANPAFKVNDDTATVMPPDVTAVMDHGKRAVSTYPVATGEYYKMDYSAGVDISRYKNIPVPTSFMAHKSEFDFVGGYDFGRKAGMYHFADHHISPGKKQWTWGCGDFGKAWDRNLTDEDGPYVELMTGCFTDNQPDFTYIRPCEEKTFTQYFMPYREVGYIKNANRDFCLGTDGGILRIYCTGEYGDVRVTAVSGGKTVLDCRQDFTPHTRFSHKIPEDAEITVQYAGGTLHYDPAKVKKFPVPAPAEAIPEPSAVQTADELYLYGTHIEQYRHATRLPEAYYEEGLRRDPTDARLNCAYGSLLLRRGEFARSKEYFERAIAKCTAKNPNPPATDPFFGLATAQMLLGETDAAYDNFYKCVWSNENKSAALYSLAAIDLRRGDAERAGQHAAESIRANGHNIKALDLAGIACRRMGDEEGAMRAFAEAEKSDPLDCIALFERGMREGKPEAAFGEGVTDYEATEAAKEYLQAGESARARSLLECYCRARKKVSPVVHYYLGYIALAEGRDPAPHVTAASAGREVIYFPNRLFDIALLEALEQAAPSSFAEYCLGNAFYDKRQYARAAAYWEESAQREPHFPAVRRNLALYYYNKKGDAAAALRELEAAFAEDRKDSRIMTELFQLYRRVGKSDAELAAFLRENAGTAEERDDLWLEYIALVCGEDPVRAESLILSRRFHPWEGGEGKVTRLYKRIKIALYEREKERGDLSAGIKKLREALTYPENLGEGKLILDTDNDVHYFLGEGYELSGNEEAARGEYALAARGNCTIADDVYYNDTPTEYLYYIAKAHKKLGEKERAEEIVQAMRRYAAENRGKKKTIDYFAVSLPDLLIWEEDIDERNRRFCDLLERLAAAI